MTHPSSGPDRRSVAYWAGWAALAGVLIAIVAIFVAHNDAKPASKAAPNPTQVVTGTPPDPIATNTSTTSETSTSAPVPPPVSTPAPGWSSAELLRLGDGQYDIDTAKMSGKRYPESVMFSQWSMYDGGEAEYNLGRQCTHFRTMIGFDDGASKGATADLKVVADGRKIWTRSMKFGDCPVAVDLKVAGVLRLAVGGTYDTDGIGGLGPVAGTPEVICDPPPTTPAQ
ncbi:NPCBM/NEW2 domain-containing protein [Kribbella sp. NPDC006257]|uniref:NPCBM/NEW2 domain-containing protein n=1 Tax=Kribbella sp. NPDC006257 TaxID=3156738 RepID=UPI0033BBE7DA